LNDFVFKQAVCFKHNAHRIPQKDLLLKILCFPPILICIYVKQGRQEEVEAPESDDSKTRERSKKVSVVTCALFLK